MSGFEHHDCRSATQICMPRGPPAQPPRLNPQYLAKPCPPTPHPHPQDKPFAPCVDPDLLARQTSGFSGAGVLRDVLKDGCRAWGRAGRASAARRLPVSSLPGNPGPSSSTLNSTRAHCVQIPSPPLPRLPPEPLPTPPSPSPPPPPPLPPDLANLINEAALLAAQSDAMAITAPMVDHAYDKVSV